MPHNILAIGEILWDVFPDGPRFGGAPANFGCISAELGQEIVSDDSVCELPGTPVKVIDTVGVGDAFTALMTLGQLTGHNLETINRNAIATASYVCFQPGATMPFPDHLRHGEAFDRT